MIEPLLIHYSSEPLTSVHSVEQMDHPLWKPQGLWLSVEDGWGWREWCESQKFNLEDLKCRTRVELHPDSHILRLSSKEEILDFDARYAKSESIFSEFLTTVVNWREVAREWQGIIIAPYQWELRLDSQVYWYYSWDVSSGCIWDADAIASLEPMIDHEGECAAVAAE